MKELSIEEKAKRYDEAKLRISAAYNSNRCTIGFMNEIFPELKESEDEKIRKDMLEYCYKRMNNEFPSITIHQVKRWLAWLEKQGEQKPIISNNALREGITHFGITQYQIDNWLKKYVDIEKQGEKGTNGNEREIPNSEQKPADKVEPKFKVGDTIRPRDPVLGEPRIIKGIHPKFGYDTNKGILDFEFEDNWELVEQNPAWGEEDETRLTNIIIMLKEGASLHFNKKDITKAVDWLKFLKDRVQPQPKQEWGEEDEDILNTIINHFKIDIECTDEDDTVRWLKFLKDRVQPQPKQEWGEEDENRMKKVMHILSLDGRISNAELQSIYDWLKSLRPQKRWKPSEEQLESLKLALYGEAFKLDELQKLYEQLKALV